MSASTSQLTIYNAALRMCEERKLANLSEAREPQRLLTDAWNDGAVQYCLEQGQWNWATRVLQIDYDPGFAPNFGFQFVFEHPADWVRTTAVCSDPYFLIPLTRYYDHAGFWYADQSPLYIKQVSNDANFGNNMALWPQTFETFVAAYLAKMIIKKLTKDKALREDVKKEYKEARTDALSKDQMGQPEKFPPMGSWNSARGARYNRWDGGNRNSLIG